MNNWYAHCSAAGIYPVFAELVPVAAVDRLDCVAKVVKNAGECFEGPTGAA